MKLWLLRPIKTTPEDDAHEYGGSPWDPWYARAFGFVVRAIDEVQARQVVARSGLTGDENGPDWDADDPYHVSARSVWLDPTLATCVELTLEGDAGIVLRDFRDA